MIISKIISLRKLILFIYNKNIFDIFLFLIFSYFIKRNNYEFTRRINHNMECKHKARKNAKQPKNYNACTKIYDQVLTVLLVMWCLPNIRTCLYIERRKHKIKLIHKTKIRFIMRMLLIFE